jgi:hypothetical protein
MLTIFGVIVILIVPYPRVEGREPKAAAPKQKIVKKVIPGTVTNEPRRPKVRTSGHRVQWKGFFGADQRANVFCWELRRGREGYFDNRNECGRGTVGTAAGASAPSISFLETPGGKVVLARDTSNVRCCYVPKYFAFFFYFLA